jgi:class 3 adenylate cyclase
VSTRFVGSTERVAALGDIRWRDLLASHGIMVRRDLNRYRGSELKTLGDGFLAAFDGPARAIRCGVSVARAAFAAGVPIRVGLHTGECEIVGGDLAGITVHIAARIGALAQPNEVLVSRTLKDLVAGSDITFADRGTHTLKGVPDDWHLYAVSGV